MQKLESQAICQERVLRQVSMSAYWLVYHRVIVIHKERIGLIANQHFDKAFLDKSSVKEDSNRAIRR